MAEVVVMQKMNLTMEEGTLAEWYKSEGDLIAVDEPLCCIENAKTIEDMQSMVSGTVLKILGEVGETYPVAAPIAIVGNPNEDITALLAQITEKESMSAKQDADTAIIVSEVLPKTDPVVKMLPKIRKLIKDKGIDLGDLVGFTGDKKITEADVEAFEKFKAGKGGTVLMNENDKSVKMSNMRKAIAKNMSESCAHTARLTNFMEVDMTALFETISDLKAKGVKLSTTALVIKACANALRKHEIINSSLNEESNEIILWGKINISCAVDMPGGLVVPVIKNADQKDINEITAEVAALAAKAQDGKLTNDEISEGTFTVSNVGMLDVSFFTPIINYPQTAILGVGNVTIQPRYADDSCSNIIPKRIMTIALTYDHRVIDGAPAARFLQDVRDSLQSPKTLL